MNKQLQMSLESMSLALQNIKNLEERIQKTHSYEQAEEMRKQAREQMENLEDIYKRFKIDFNYFG